jgi:hypothetical protein
MTQALQFTPCSELSRSRRCFYRAATPDIPFRGAGVRESVVAETKDL